MIAVGCVLLYLGIARKYEPLLLVPIGFGAILVNLPLTGIFDDGGLLRHFYFAEAASIAIIGGADGPTAIYLTSQLADHLLGPIAVAAYSYMALVPVIQPPIIRLLTSKAERRVRMREVKPVSRRVKIVFPVATTIVAGLVVPASVPLVGMLMLGNLLRESGVVNRLADTAQNELINIVTILLATAIGSKMSAGEFLTLDTLLIIALGLVAFTIGTASGVLLGKLMYVLTRGRVNPMIGAAGVSAVPMAARVVQKAGAEEDAENFLLMHAMGPNVAGVIGSAVAAGILLALGS
ncbi:MAG: sodium ion-translocating decarboxylase subunit beta [Spirochaetota bacterium]